MVEYGTIAARVLKMDPFAQEQEDVRLGGSQTPGLPGAPADGNEAELRPGSVIAERFRVLRLIGQGNMGSVYEVEQIFLKRHFALKTLHPINKSDVIVRRFQKEALAASKLEHPNLVRAYDFGLIEGVQPYFIMDLVYGQTLAEHLKKNGALTVTEALQIFCPLCEAMEYAHETGIVHRDIKPSNIMLVKNTKDGASPVVPKLVDFGIAKLLMDEGSATQALTKTGEIFGTPLYMSPEQCMGGQIDSRSDIYSLGCVIFEALTGAPPFTGASPLETMMHHNSTIPPSLKEASVGLDFPPHLQRAVAKALAKDPNDRYLSCTELRQGLLGHDKSDVVPKVVVADANRNKLVALTVVVLLVIGMATAAFVMHKQTAAPEPSASATGTGTGTETDSSDVEGEKITKQVIDGNRSAKFRSAKDGVWEYDFGPESIGHIAANPKRSKDPDWQRAVNIVILKMKEGDKPNLIFFKGDSSFFLERPNWLERFEKDELYDLEFTRPRDISLFTGVEDTNVTLNFDTMLTYARAQTALGELRLNSCPVSVKGLQNMDLDGLQLLNRLHLKHTEVDGKQLAKFKILSRLEELDMSEMKNPLDVFRKVAHSPKMILIQAEGDNLTDSDVARVAMPRLMTFDVANNPLLDNKAFTDLEQRFPRLYKLDVCACGVTPKLIDQLAKCDTLRQVEISAPGWTINDVRKLRSVLNPRARVTIHMHSRDWSREDASALTSLPNVVINALDKER
ncbi:MAG TPA: protein kinase [Planktothrix sp.]|jgi:hypothetical protein